MSPVEQVEQDDLQAEIGHELRGPLTGIQALADALSDEVFGPLDAGQKQALGLIRDGVKRQTGLIADLIDLRRLEMGAGSLSPVQCQVDEVVALASANVAELVKARKVSLVTEIAPAGLKVRVDSRRFGQIVTHLLAAGILAADMNGVAWLLMGPLTGHQGLRLQLVVAPPGIETQPKIDDSDAMTSDPAVERRIRKLGPTGLLLLRAILALHEGTLVIRETGEGCLLLVASLPLPD